MNKQDNGVFYAIAVIVIVILVLTFMLLTNPEAAQAPANPAIPVYEVQGCLVNVLNSFSDFHVSDGWIYFTNWNGGYIMMAPIPDCKGTVRVVN